MAAAIAAVALTLIGGCGGGGEDGSSAPTTTIPSTAALGWTGAGIRNVCVETAATFEGEPVSTEQVFEGLGLASQLQLWNLAIAPAGTACDATLRVELTGTALSGIYGSARQELYVGHDITGQITLAAPNQPTLSHPFAHRDEPQANELVHDPQPTAPLDALPNALSYVPIAPALEQFFGPCCPSTTTTT